MDEKNPYLSSLPAATPSIFGSTGSNKKQSTADTVRTGGKVIGTVVGGVAGAYSGGPAGAVKGASLGMQVGEAAGDSTVKTFGIDGKDRSLWERLGPDQKSLTALKSIASSTGGSGK